MSESERRRRMRYDRVLIESARILAPQFDDAVLYFTGAQIELLRNVTQYLRRLETYVAEYHLGYYLTPTVADYDDLLAIVSDMEETLMGNENVIFGYRETLFGQSQSTVSGAGDKVLYFNTVPEGEVWRIEAFNARNEDTSCSRIQLVAAYPSGDTVVRRQENPAIDELVTYDGMLTLFDDCTLKAELYDCADGDFIRAELRGYIMDVPI